MSDADQQVFDLMSTIAGAEGSPDPSQDPPTGDVSVNPPNEPETEEQKDLKRYEYWQAKAQRAEEEAKKNAFAAPIARLLDEKPELALTIQAAIAQQGQRAPEGPKRPEPPVKPAGYDPVAAYSDPTSESFKFREQQENYRESLVTYLEGQTAQREQAIQAELRKRAQQEEEAVKLAQLRMVLAQKGLKPIEIEEFLQEMARPDMYNADNMIMLHRINKQLKLKGPGRPASQPPKAPTPGFTGGAGGKVEPEDVNKMFSGSLKKASKSS